MDLGHTIKAVATGMPAMFLGGKPAERAGAERLAWFKPELRSEQQQMMVRSDAFEANAIMPSVYSADGRQISPPIGWSTPPTTAGSLALIVEDPDAPTPEPFVHWLLYNIPPTLRGLPENIGHEKTVESIGGAMQGKNSNLKIGWTGMAPPKGDIPHHYHFQLFALDQMLPLDPGAGRGALLKAMAGRVIGRGEIVGMYQR